MCNFGMVRGQLGFVDGLKEKKLEPHFYYTNKIQYKIQCKTNKLQNA